MKIPYFKAKDKDSGHVIKGFYFEYPSTTYCFDIDYQKYPVKIISCLVYDEMSDWGLPNRPMLCKNIDKTTLELIGYIDTDNEQYIPKEWIKIE